MTAHHHHVDSVMDKHITLLRADRTPPDPGRISFALPPDLLAQVRERVRLLALFLAVGFAIDPVLYFANWGAAALVGAQLPMGFLERLPFQWANLGGVVASAGLWAVARNARVAPSRMLSIGLVYEVFICFVIALGTIWEHYLVTHVIPFLTWVPVVVIIFPLILPGPPRRMLVAATAAVAMVPVALILLDLRNIVPVTPDDYVDATIQSVFLIGLAYMGARVVYGLGREVAKARELGSYRLEEKLGEGGMGEVWRAKHRMLARPAAIKLIRPSAIQETRSGVALRRFEREAQVIASLRSPHTVDLFDFGVASDGAFYYVMELLEGLDTDTLVRRFGPVPAERAVFLLRQVCHSLSEAESHGLVHRDIKPANIFLCSYGEDYDFVKVLDFGLVKNLDEPMEEGPPLTRENAIQGTPAFIAPEQALGHREVDGRVDIYALGCVAYWLLTGQLVFTAETPIALVLHHANTLPTPPSARTELVIPEALERLVMSCLAKDPAARPQSARELQRRLDELDGPNPWTEERAREWWAKHRPASLIAERSAPA
jgi:serine/threonine-protein kinase